MKKSIGFALCGLVLVGVIGISLSRRETAQEIAPNDASKRVHIAASFYPLGFFAERVGGSNAEVTVMTPAGAEPHDYELTPGDIRTLERADMIVINGAGMEPWETWLMSQPSLKDKTVRVSDHVALLSFAEEHEHEDEEEHDHEHAHEHGALDPHVWLDPVLSQEIVGAIAERFVVVRPELKDETVQSTTAIQQELVALDAAYREGLSQCKQRAIVVSHDAFSYPAKRYNITTHAIAGVSPGEEPSAQRLAALAEEVKEAGITTIFFETLVSPKLAETLAAETGATAAVLNPLEGLSAEEQQSGQNYMTIMTANLVALKRALLCQ